MKKETEYISVWITKAPAGRRAFRCVNCGKIAFEYSGDVRGLVFGDNTEESPTVHMCKGTIEGFDILGNRFSERCHTKYVIS